GLRMSAAADKPVTIRAGNPPACSTRPKPISTMTPPTAISIWAAVPTSPDRRHRKCQGRRSCDGLFCLAIEAVLDDDDLGADRDALVKLDDILVAHADAARRHG